MRVCQHIRIARSIHLWKLLYLQTLEAQKCSSPHKVSTCRKPQVHVVSTHKSIQRSTYMHTSAACRLEAEYWAECEDTAIQGFTCQDNWRWKMAFLGRIITMTMCLLRQGNVRICLSPSVPQFFRFGMGGMLENAWRKNKAYDKCWWDAVGHSNGLTLLLTPNTISSSCTF